MRAFGKGQNPAVLLHGPVRRIPPGISRKQRGRPEEKETLKDSARKHGLSRSASFFSVLPCASWPLIFSPSMRLMPVWYAIRQGASSSRPAFAFGAFPASRKASGHPNVKFSFHSRGYVLTFGFMYVTFFRKLSFAWLDFSPIAFTNSMKNTGDLKKEDFP